MENLSKNQDSGLKIDNELKLQEVLNNEGNETKLLNELITQDLSKDSSTKSDISKFIQQEIENDAIRNKDTPAAEKTENVTERIENENNLKDHDSKETQDHENETSLSHTKDEIILKDEDTTEEGVSSDNLMDKGEKTAKESSNINEKQKKSADINQEKTPKENENTSDKEPKKIGEWEDILGSGSILRKVLLTGAENSRPHRSDICTIKYKCTLEDGTLVEQEDYTTIQLGDLEVVQGVDLALALMDIGEKCLLRIVPRLAFGAEGLENRVPPNTPVLYEVELVFAQPEPDMGTLTIEERKAKGDIKKKRGNWWYLRGEHTLAIQCYRRALDYLDEVEGGVTDPVLESYDPVQRELNDAALQSLMEDRINVSNNMAQAQLKMGAHDAALQSLQMVLRCQPNNIKALYRKSKILRDKNEIQQALSCLNKAKQLAPENLTIQKEIQDINSLLKKDKDYEKELARRMFSGPDSKQPKKGGSDNRSKTYIWVTVVLSVAAGIAGVAAWRFKFA